MAATKAEVSSPLSAEAIAPVPNGSMFAPLDINDFTDSRHLRGQPEHRRWGNTTEWWAMWVCRLRTPVKLDAFVNDFSHTSSPVSPLRRVRRPISSGTLASSSVSPETTTCPCAVVATCFDSPVPSAFASGVMSWPAPVAQTAFYRLDVDLHGKPIIIVLRVFQDDIGARLHRERDFALVPADADGVTVRTTSGLTVIGN